MNPVELKRGIHLWFQRLCSHRSHLYPLMCVLLACLFCVPGHAQTPPTIQLPIEVMGPVGTTATVNVTLPAGISSTTTYQLWMQIHSLVFADKVSVQVNNNAWVPLDNSTVTVLGNAANYGGIGGGFSTISMNLTLPPGTLVSGQNSLSFRFNNTAGFASGFRVLAFNFLDANGNDLLPASTFVQENPNTWQPPLNDAADIAAGKTLYQTATLLQNSNPGAPQILAHCGDCHTQDGRDLKYFNYSNNAIIARSVFHGLTTTQGQQIASYIRSLNVPNPGQPWNPPYQPGPGLDSQPISQWAAGAGLSAVLPSDAGMLTSLFPNGITTAAVATNSNLDIRDIPTALQFPDWNHWLPRVHPLDAWGATFLNSQLLYDYNGTGGGSNTWNLQSVLNTGYIYSNVHPAATPTAANIPALFASSNVPILMTEFGNWGTARYNLLTNEVAALGSNGSTNSAALALNVYSTAQWQLVKTWELMQEYQLEGCGPVIFGSTYGEPRTWFVDTPFKCSPFMLHIPDDANGIGGSAISNEYFSNVWYQVQLTLNDSNHAYSGTSPIDWAYVYGKIKDMWYAGGSPEPMRLVEYLDRGMQVSDNGTAPNSLPSGWSPGNVGDISRLVHPSWYPMFNILPASTTQQIFQAMLQTWFTKTSQYTPAQYYAAGLASATYVPSSLMDGQFGDKVMFMIPKFQAAGVSPTLLNQITTWAMTVWPQGNWKPLLIPLPSSGTTSPNPGTPGG